MTAEIIYGVDFRAGKEEAPLCNAPDWPEPAFTVLGPNRAFIHATGAIVGWADTAPSEYSAPSDDCA